MRGGNMKRRRVRAFEIWGRQPPQITKFTNRWRKCECCFVAFPERGWPIGVHPCACDGWHIVCEKCVAKHEMVGDPFVVGRDQICFGKLRACPVAVQMALALMEGQ